MEATITLEKPIINESLTVFIKDTTNALKEVQKIKEVEELLDQVIAQPFQIKFNNLKLWMLTLFFALVCSGYIFKALNTISYHWNYFDLIFIIILLVGFFWPIGLISSRASSITNLNQLFIKKTLHLLYKIGPSTQNFVETINNKFVDFDRGNYSQNVSWCKELEFNNEDQNIRVNALQHHYVIERIVTEKVRNGRGGYKTVKKKVYDHYYREGLVFPPIAEFKSLVISHHEVRKAYTQTFKLASIVFDVKFYVMANSEFSAAKFLGPSVVLAFEKLSSQFNGVTFEIATDGSILLNQKHTGILNSNVSSSIVTPREFKEDLLKNLTLGNVNIMFAFMNNLIKYLGK